MEKTNHKSKAEHTGAGYKKRLVFMIYVLLLGAIIGALIWLFFKIMDSSLVFLWEVVPAHVNSPWYPVMICTLGGLVIGICQKKIGVYPEELEHVMAQVKTTGGYEYKKTPGIALCALLPLVFGGSIGPEAGLTGVVAGLCTWAGERFKYVASEMKELANIGMAAALGAIFNAPLFGFMAPIESDNEAVEIPKVAKTIVYFTAIFGGLGSYVLLKNTFGGGMIIGRFDECTIGRPEVIWFIPLALTGAAAGYLYYASGKLADILLAPIRQFVVLRAVIGGLLLGICGMFLPFTMFAGETQMGLVMETWVLMPATTLFLTGFFKIFITNVCLKTGWRGGNIFPLIFSGICFGFSMAHLSGIDSVFAVTIVTASLCGMIMRKPLAVTLLLLICFPVKGIIAMTAAAFIGASLPLPDQTKISRS